ncbi:MAG TPA: hypothetical protein VIL00_06905 [Pseudonocardiaceae bacterium]
MVRPERRTRGDLAAVALLLVVAVVGGVVLWWRSDARTTVSETTADAPPAPPAPTTVPTTLQEVWRAPSSATPQPVALGPHVVTGHDGEVAGRDPSTGEIRWRYARDLPLCTVGSAWGRAVAVYRRSDTVTPSGERGAEYCSEVTALDPATGRRTAQRNGDAEPGTRLISDGRHLTATGGELIEVWRSDLVMTLQYGQVLTPVNPNKQPRPECSHLSFAMAPGKLGVLERCPNEPADRLTLLKPDPQESEKPEELATTLVGAQGAQLVTLTNDRAAVLLPDPPRLAVFDDRGTYQTEYRLDLPASDLDRPLPGRVVPQTGGAGAVYWFTGSRTVALATSDLHPMWSVEGTLGPGVVFAGQLLLPVPDGLLVVDPATGERKHTIPVDRQGYTGTVELASLGPVLLEQRGEVLVALR